MTALLTDPADQSGGWYIREEEAVAAAQAAMERRYASTTYPAAMACLAVAAALIAQGEDPRAACIQSSVTETRDQDLELLNGRNKLFITSPGYLAWHRLRRAISERIGTQKMPGAFGRGDFDDWYQSITSDDIAKATVALEEELDYVRWRYGL